MVGWACRARPETLSRASSQTTTMGTDDPPSIDQYFKVPCCFLGLGPILGH